jgi:chromosome segregation ATPase
MSTTRYIELRFFRPLQRARVRLDPQLAHLDSLLHSLHRKVNLIMANNEQLAAELRAVSTQLAKIGVETSATLAKVVELETIIANGGTSTPEVDEALAELKARAQAADDLVPDAPSAP